MNGFRDSWLRHGSVRRRVARLWPGVLIWLFIAVAPRAVAEERLLFDFETSPLAKDWSAVGPVEAARAPAGIPPQGVDAPSGNALVLKCRGPAGCFAKSGLVPTDWTPFSRVALWVYRDPASSEAGSKTILEIQCVEADGKARFARRFEADHSGWKRISLPLDGFRWGDGRVPRWDRIDRLGIALREAGEAAVDNITVEAGQPGAAGLTLEEVAAIAFPEAKPAALRTFASERIEIVGDVASLDAQALADRMTAVAAALFDDLPFLQDRPGKGRLLVFATRDDYRSFPGRLAKTLGAVGAEPTSHGYTLHGLATSYWDDKFGALRPVFAHEFVHSLLSNCGLLQNSGEWLQEGLASRYQLRFHPQADIDEIVKRGLADPKLRTPFAEICRGKRVPTERYWQAMTLVDMLLTEPEYAESFPKLFDEMLNSGSTDLEPHLERVLHSSWDKLTTDWTAYCRKRFP